MTEQNASFTLYQLLTEISLLLDDSDRRALDKHQLSLRQFYTLYHLHRSPHISINSLTEKLFCDKSNTTRVVERLKQDGLVYRQRDTSDRRFVSIGLTEQGTEVYKEAMETHHNSVNQRFEEFKPEEKELLEKLLTKLLGSLKSQLNNPTD